MTFRQLAVGDTFIFEAESRYIGWERGPWRKTSARKYVQVETGLDCEVGTVNAEVIKETV